MMATPRLPWSSRWRTTAPSPWRRARRKFFELHEAGSPVATEAVRRIGEPDEIEATIRGQPPDERALRPIAPGRKNSPSAGSEAGARRQAIVASLVETAKLNEAEPLFCFQNVRACLIEGHQAQQLDALLPWHAEPAGSRIKPGSRHPDHTGRDCRLLHLAALRSAPVPPSPRGCYGPAGM